MTMQKLDIAGLTVSYRNAPDLGGKVQQLIQNLKGKRAALEDQAKGLRMKERELERFLGVSDDVRAAPLEKSHA